MRPSDLFRERFITCFIDDAAGVEIRDDVGIDRITWECDYPHSDSTWPRLARAAARSRSPACPTHEINAMTHENAMRLFHYDPFAVIPREQATVGALRAQATDVDTRPKSSGKPFERPDDPRAHRRPGRQGHHEGVRLPSHGSLRSRSTRSSVGPR